MSDSRRGWRMVLVIVAIMLLGWAGIAGGFVYYRKIKTDAFRETQSAAVAKIEILDENNPRNAVHMTLSDRADMAEFVTPLREAEFYLPNHPRLDRKYTVTIQRRDGRREEYLLFIDERGPDRDFIQEIVRTGNSTRYYGAYHAMGLRAAVGRALSD